MGEVCVGENGEEWSVLWMEGKLGCMMVYGN